jgi:uncharacterized SAM-binding protein YcdF (DUF218 family)
LLAVAHRTVRWRGLVTLVAVVALAVGIGQTGAGHAMLQKAGLFQRPASYTSLAFSKRPSVSEKPKSKRADVSVSFVIHNTGATPRDYQWSVLVSQGPLPRRVADGRVHVPSGRGATVTQTAKITCTPGQMRIVVSLARPAEFIDAWMTCPSRRR